MPVEEFPGLNRAELETLIALVECSEPVDEVSEFEESALEKLRGQLSYFDWMVSQKANKEAP